MIFEQTIVRCPRPNCGDLQQEKGPFILWAERNLINWMRFQNENLDKLEDKNGERPRKNLPWGKPKEVPSVQK